MLPNNDTWRKNKCNCWENIIIPRICSVIPKIRKLKTIKNHIEWIFILVHYSLVQMSTWNYHRQKTNWYFFVNGLVAVRNGCWCSLKVTICSCFSGKSDESGNKLVMFSKNLYLAQCFFSHSCSLSVSHRSALTASRDWGWTEKEMEKMKEAEMRHRQIVRYRNWGWGRMSELGRLYTSAFWSFWLWSFSLMAGWSDTRLVQENVQATTMCNTLL